MKPKPKKRGRPPMPPGQRKAERLEFVLTTEERQAAERAAQRAGLSLSAWVRERIGRAARREARM